MDVREVLIDLFDRVAEHVQEAVDGLGTEALVTPPEPGANTIGWLVWHLTRVQDDHVAEILDEEQEWVSGNWGGRFGVAPDPKNTGYGHSWKEVMSIQPENAGVLVAYYSAVAARTRQLIEGTTEVDLDRVVDERWDPPVTLGVRLISVADDDIQHAAQAAYVRGIFDRR
jgi:hypothetical protein